jgi:hypothetical protein
MFSVSSMRPSRDPVFQDSEKVIVSPATGLAQPRDALRLGIAVIPSSCQRIDRLLLGTVITGLPRRHRTSLDGIGRGQAAAGLTTKLRIRGVCSGHEQAENECLGTAADRAAQRKRWAAYNKAKKEKAATKPVKNRNLSAAGMSASTTQTRSAITAIGLLAEGQRSSS